VKDPRAAQKQAEINHGWLNYRKLTDSLDAAANQLGFQTHRDSPELMAMKREEVEKLQQSNMSWWEDYSAMDNDRFEREFIGVREVAYAKSMQGKPGIETLQAYIELRDSVSNAREILEQRGVEVDSEIFSQVYAKYVSRLVESNTRFSAEWFNGYLERDPLLPQES
jgi:hypothetical protein